MARKKRRRNTPGNPSQSTQLVKIGRDKRLEQIASNLAQEHYEILGSHYKERLRQSRMVSNVTVFLLVIGVLIVFIGIALLLKNDITSGIVTTSSGIISDIIIGVIFKFNKDSNDRLDITAEDMGYFERVRTSEVLMDKITDPDRKDILIDDLIRSMLTVDTSIGDKNEQKQKIRHKRGSHAKYQRK